MIGRAIGTGFIVSRDFVARGLIALRIRPNSLTFTGIFFTLLAGICYAINSHGQFGWSISPIAPRNAYLMLAGALLILASACDMLDGAVARLANLKTTFGAFLDSTLDRFSDFVVFAGIAIFYAWHSQPANLTFIFGCMFAFFNAFMISYTKARAEDLIPECNVGYWQRGERSAAILIATFAHNIPALVVQQAISPFFSAMLRIFYTRAIIEGRTPLTDPRQGPWHFKIRLWRWPRMSVPYDVITGLNIAWLIFAPVEKIMMFLFGTVDPFRTLAEIIGAACR